MFNKIKAALEILSDLLTVIISILTLLILLGLLHP